MEQIVLIIDKNTSLFEQIRSEWNKYHVDIYGVTTLDVAVRELRRQEYALVMAFADYLKESLLEGIRLLRSISSLPILVLTNHYHPEMQAAAIKAGADQYIAIPETIPEMIVIGVGLVRRHLEFSRTTPVPPMMLEHSGLLLCVDQYRAFVQGTEVALTPYEYKLLLLLLENKYRVLTYNQLFQHLWGEEYSDSPPRLVTNLVSKLRSKLRINPNVPEYIQNVHGTGYKFDP